MRTALVGLTSRGRFFVGVGIAVMAFGLLLGERDLLRVGLFLLVLPLVAATVVSRTRFRLAGSRRVEPSRIPAGREATVRLRIHNVSRIPTGLLFVEDHIPYTLGSRPRFVLERIESRGTRELTYPVRCEVRGRFRVGPLSIRLTDPFGLVELGRSFAETEILTVTPAVTPLPRIRLAGDWVGDGDGRSRTAAAAGEDDVATREYRHGDDLRRVHWGATAHRGELMVRQEEQRWQSRSVMLLDSRRSVHRGTGPGSSFERAVSAAASIGVHLIRAGYDTRFFTENGYLLPAPGVQHGDGLGESALLDALAVVPPSRNFSLRTGIETIRGRTSDDLVVCVLGALDDDDVNQLCRLSRTPVSCLAVLFDTASWLSLSGASRAQTASEYSTRARDLERNGWTVVPAAAGTDLSTAWRLVGERSALSPSRTGSPQ